MEFNSFGLMSVLKGGGQSSANASLLLDKGKANASKASTLCEASLVLTIDI